MISDNLEMQKLEKMLQHEGIPYGDASDNFDPLSGFPRYEQVDRIHIYLKKHMVKLVSVIHGYGTYGGYKKPDKSDDAGLLEVESFKHDDVLGFQTADDAFHLIKEAIDNKEELVTSLEDLWN